MAKLGLGDYLYFSKQGAKTRGREGQRVRAGLCVCLCMSVCVCVGVWVFVCLCMCLWDYACVCVWKWELERAWECLFRYCYLSEYFLRLKLAFFPTEIICLRLTDCSPRFAMRERKREWEKVREWACKREKGREEEEEGREKERARKSACVWRRCVGSVWNLLHPFYAYYASATTLG